MKRIDVTDWSRNRLEALVDAGVTLHCDIDAYTVIKDSVPQYLIHFKDPSGILPEHWMGFHGRRGTKYENRCNGTSVYFYAAEGGPNA